MAAEEILARLSAFANCHREVWQRLVAAGAETYLAQIPGPEVAAGRAEGNALARRLTAALKAVRPGLDDHLREEEEILVPHLLPALGDRVGPLASMLQEHRQIRAAMAALLPAAAGQGPPGRLGELLLLVDDHLRKEKYILFPLAREIIGAGKG